MPGTHARLSPSGAKGWLNCSGRLALESEFPNTSNVHSDNGTACHTVASECLSGAGLVSADWLGEMVKVSDPDEPERRVFFDQKLCDMTTDYVDAVRELAKDRELYVEQKVDFTSYVYDESETQEEERQTGTADALILWSFIDNDTGEIGDELIVIDLKTGYHFVPVEQNPQLMLYALGALDMFVLTHDIKRVRLMIYQPPHGGMREWVVSIEELLAFAAKAKTAAARVDAATELHLIHFVRGSSHEREGWARTFLHPDPNEIDCAFCRAMSTCPAARAKVEQVVGAGFDVITDETEQVLIHAPAFLADRELGVAMKAAGFLEDFIKATRAETERRLMLGQPVKWGDGDLDGYGLELGRAGARAWADPKEAERMLREQFRLKIEDAYDLTLISPTTAEKLAKVKAATKKNPMPEKPLLTEARWKKLQPLIARSDPKPSVKPLAIIKELYSPIKPDADAFGVVDDGVKMPPTDDEDPLC